MAGDWRLGLGAAAPARDQTRQHAAWLDRAGALLGSLSPAAIIGVLIAAQVVVWTLAPYIFHTSMPLDVTADGVSWGHEWQLGYYKHPPLPGWLVEAFFDAFGDFGPFLLSQLAVGVTYFLVYRLGCELLGPQEAAAGTILLAAVYYFSIPTPEWNHNIAQLPFWAAIVLAYWRVCTRGTLVTWVVLGLCAGTGMLVKYSVATLLAALFLHFLWSGRAHRNLRSWGPYVTMGVFALVVALHAAWVVQHGYTTVHFFEGRAGQAGSFLAHVFAPIRFLGAQLLALLPAVLVAAVAGFFRWPTIRKLSLSDADRLLVMAWAGPPLLTAIFSLVSGLGLRDMWGMPMWDLTGLILVRLAAPCWQHISWRRLSIGVTACFVVYPICYVAATVVGPHLLGVPSRTEWPERAIATAANAVWQNNAHTPLRIVTGESWIAGLVAMQAPRPSVFIDADFAKAPWVSPKRLEEEGTLIVWQEQPAAPTLPAVLKLAQSARSHGTLQFAWPLDARMAPLRIGWAVVPPHASPQGEAKNQR